jgi:hypothetical protein
MSRLSFLIIAVVALLVSVSSLQRVLSARSQAPQVEYRVLATTKTSTMEEELNEAAEAGFRFQAFMGGETAFGGDEVVAVLVRKGAGAQRFAYKLLATTKTSTMQQELQETADMGFEYRGQSVFSSFFGGDEVVLVLERDKDAEPSRFEYSLVATSKTATLQKELAAAALAGFEVVGLTVSKTAIGGSELVAITRRPRVP